MREHWLLIDANYVAWRAFHSLKNKGLSVGDMRTETVFGFFRDLRFFQDLHCTHNLAFCFDRKPERRLEILPTYKGNRRDLPPGEERDQIMAARAQIRNLRRTILKEAGFRNIFSQRRYEADDIIASLTRRSIRKKFTIISADSDLFQLLHSGVRLWNPHTRHLLTDKDFQNKYGISPAKWSLVKAIAGCASDNVPGIRGVGELTALRYLRGELPTHSKSSQAIREGEEIIQRNLLLVRLPMEGTKSFLLREDKETRGGWASVVEKFHLRSLAKK